MHHEHWSQEPKYLSPLHPKSERFQVQNPGLFWPPSEMGTGVVCGGIYQTGIWGIRPHHAGDEDHSSWRTSPSRPRCSRSKRCLRPKHFQWSHIDQGPSDHVEPEQCAWSTAGIAWWHWCSNENLRSQTWPAWVVRRALSNLRCQSWALEPLVPAESSCRHPNRSLGQVVQYLPDPIGLLSSQAHFQNECQRWALIFLRKRTCRMEAIHGVWLLRQSHCLQQHAFGCLNWHLLDGWIHPVGLLARVPLHSHILCAILRDPAQFLGVLDLRRCAF